MRERRGAAAALRCAGASPYDAAAAAISPIPGVNRRGDSRPASPRPEEPSQRGRIEPERRETEREPTQGARTFAEAEREAGGGEQRPGSVEVQSAPAPPVH